MRKIKGFLGKKVLGDTVKNYIQSDSRSQVSKLRMIF